MELAHQLRDRTRSVVDVVEAHIARIEAINPRLTAMVADDFVAARQAALAAEVRLANAPRQAPLPPLLGVPFTVQEAVGVAGRPCTGGLVYRWNAVAEQDAPAVQRLRAAGAIPLGLTNVPEAGLWLETHNLIYGRTVSPWDEQHTPGGACGGEAALIAAGGSPLGVGSGLVSAVTVPAAFCGIPAHQPSHGLAPPALGWGTAARAYLGCGVLARSTSDLRLLVEIITGKALTAPPPLSALRVRVLDTIGPAQASPVVREGLERCAAALAERGATVTPLVLPALDDAMAAWAALLAARAPEDVHTLLGAGSPVPVWKEVLRVPLGRANHTSSALLLAMLEALRRLLPDNPAAHQAAAEQIRAALTEQLSPPTVLLHPAYSRPAPRHRSTLTSPADLLFSGLFGMLGFPSTVVPIGFDVSGLPLAVQLTALPGEDHLTIAAAAALEQAFGGWVRAQPLS